MKATQETLNDIMESIKAHLAEVALGEEPQTIDQLMDSWDGSGEITEREWVVRAANELVVLGLVEGGEDPNRPLRPTRSYVLHLRSKDAARTFPNDRTCIELIPNDSNPDVDPVWRIVVWGQPEVGPFARAVTIKDVAEADLKRLNMVLRMAPWRIVWHAKVINEAIRALGIERLKSATPKSDEPELQLRVYEDCIRAKYRTGDNEDKVMEYDLRGCLWVVL